uniref:Uncharacterized protein n=1 Tax=Cyanothece sp. (strain PCC 7425 / ATCC 29141) TaxID=395961 RepID=B8HL20_CYAP4
MLLNVDISARSPGLNYTTIAKTLTTLSQSLWMREAKVLVMSHDRLLP